MQRFESRLILRKTFTKTSSFHPTESVSFHLFISCPSLAPVSIGWTNGASIIGQILYCCRKLPCPSVHDVLIRTRYSIRRIIGIGVVDDGLSSQARGRDSQGYQCRGFRCRCGHVRQPFRLWRCEATMKAYILSPASTLSRKDNLERLHIPGFRDDLRLHSSDDGKYVKTRRGSMDSDP